MGYLFDTNIFIEGNNRYYSMDICPGFWEWLKNKNHEGVVFSIKEVADELRSDDLSNWSDNIGIRFFMTADSTTAGALREVSEWVRAETRFRQDEVADFSTAPILI